MCGWTALGNYPHDRLRLWATLCPQRPMSFVVTAPSRSGILVIPSQEERTSHPSPLWCLCICIHTVFFFFKSDITDSVAVILSRLCGQNRLYLISWKLQGAISMKEKKIQIKNQRLPTCRCCLVTKLYPTLCDPTDCSMPGFPILYYLLKFAQIRVHWVGDLTISPSAAFFSFFTSIYFTYGNVYVSVLLSQFAPPSLSPAVSKVCSLCFHLSSCPANQYRSFYFIYMH